MSTKMEPKHLLRSVLALACAAGTYAAVGCSSDSSNTSNYDIGDGSLGGVFGGGGFSTYATGGAPGTTGGTSGATGGTSGATGGTSGATGGASATGGSSTGDGGTCIVPDKPTIDPTTFPACAIASLSPECTDGRCVPKTLVPADSQSLLATCDDKTLCVPSLFVAYVNKFLAKTCTSLAQAEGRCMSLCVPQVHDQKDQLPKDVCGDGELCAPCYDPRTGADTGACHQGCDPGPTQPPKLFDKCCSGNGECVPTAAVPAANRAQLGADTCTTAGDLCAPTKMANDLTYKPPTCKSIGDLEGRCLADCIPQIASQASRLPKSTCDTGELCAPCYDPISGNDTGACTLNGDKPVDPVKTFDKCCTDLGHCVPKTALTTDQQSLLGQDSCTNTGDLCAPDVFADSTKKPDPCRALQSFDAEGRCVPACVPAIQAQKDRLDQATCPANFLCAPCYDPLTGLSSGACDQNGDSPKEAKKVFASCCGSLGLCVPTALIPSGQIAQLGQDTCTDSGTLCAPKSLTDPTAKPPTCTAPGNIEGRCLPGCLPPIQKQASNLRQQTCATGELCADCYNPLDGTDTGACTINGDTPTQGPKLFPTCASGIGICVPTVLVPTTLQTALPQDSCAAGDLCAPEQKAKDLSYKFPACDPQIAPLPPDPNQPAACVPKYIIDYQAKTNPLAALLGQSNCQTGEICAPCTDPTSGKSTGACD